MKKSAGFTFIEILVAVVISGILFGGGIAAFRGIGARQNLKQAGIEFQSNLRLIQEKTLSSKKPAGCDVLLEYEVSYVDNIDKNTYSMKPICQPDTLTATPVVLLENVTFETSFSPISFLVLQAGVVLNEGLGVEEKTIKLQSGTLEYWVTIESKGVIKGEMH